MDFFRIIKVSLFTALLTANPACSSKPLNSNSSIAVSEVKESFDNDLCERLNGDWMFAERIDCLAERRCGEQIPMSLSCKEGDVSGKFLKAYDSKRGMATYTDVRGKLGTDSLRLTYSLNDDCSVEYSFEKLRADPIAGDIRRTGCKNTLYKDTGKVFAQRAK